MCTSRRSRRWRECPPYLKLQSAYSIAKESIVKHHCTERGTETLLVMAVSDEGNADSSEFTASSRFVERQRMGVSDLGALDAYEHAMIRPKTSVLFPWSV